MISSTLKSEYVINTETDKKQNENFLTKNLSFRVISLINQSGEDAFPLLIETMEKLKKHLSETKNKHLKEINNYLLMINNKYGQELLKLELNIIKLMRQLIDTVSENTNK